MVDYEFYRDAYLGSQIPEKAFPEAEARAREFLQYLQRNFQVNSSGEQAEKMALCAVAEGVYHEEKRGRISSASAGSVSVHYRGSEEKSLRRALLQKAAIYLDIHRGVSG